MIPASQMSLTAFLAIVACVLLALAYGVFYSYRKLDPSSAFKKTRVIMFWVFAWLAMFWAMVESGYARENPMPGVPMLFLSAILISIAFAFSPIGKKLSLGVPIGYLILFQAFRLPLELVLHEWAAQGTIPQTMTWTGQNLDIVTGIAAIVAFPFVSKYRGVARIFNIIGFGFLLNVMRVALFSSPLPFAWSIEPKLQLLTHTPYTLIVPVCVGGALIGHILLSRAVYAREAARQKEKVA